MSDLSKNEQKRRAKAEVAEKKKAEKAEKKSQEEAANPTPKKEKEAAASLEELAPTEYYKIRLAALENVPRNVAFPHKYDVNVPVPVLVHRFQHLEPAQRDEAEKVYRIGGRVSTIRTMGKIVFYDLASEGARIQVVCTIQDFAAGAQAFDDMHNSVKRGDIIGAEGFVGKTKKGELSLFATNVQLLTACLHMLPSEKGGDFTDIEVRYRRRYLDLIANGQRIRTIFEKRAAVINYVRSFLTQRRFLEVETPMMNLIPGGAAARPFETYHNDLAQKMYMRIAPELYLKMLVVGGLDRVFEIGRQFRNEGIDMTHNPEFTSCEFYMAYADYYDLMAITEEMISGMVLAINGSYNVVYHPDGQDKPAVTIDFTPPFRKIAMIPALEAAAKVKFPEDLTSEDALEMMKDLIEKHQVSCPPPQTATRMLDKLVGHFLEVDCVNPTFICDHPQMMSPLAKWHRTQPGMTERFELFINKMEFCNAFTELNDPRKQRELFEDQAKAKAQGDDEACGYDEEFCVALEHGLPPTAGWGMGIDRMAMLLTDNNTIKEVLLFPAMRPE
eukprot:c16212_g1_i1.p1 GENE.c16212_g1_i1~~c16212_g1_i1.p1  ORF type:complete len:557 (-),score=217.76 c16212_g1_i1:59-1729(-)